jgi:hypothetical protein
MWEGIQTVLLLLLLEDFRPTSVSHMSFWKIVYFWCIYKGSILRTFKIQSWNVTTLLHSKIYNTYLNMKFVSPLHWCTAWVSPLWELM